MSLSHVFKLSHTVLELWPAEDFCFRGDNHVKKMRVVFLTRDTPIGSLLHPNIIKLSQQYRTYGLHNISASGEISI